MTCGAGGVGNSSIATLLKDLRQRLSGEDSAHLDWRLDDSNYTIETVAGRVHEFFAAHATEAGRSGTPDFLLLRICGYSSGRPLPEIWEVEFRHSNLCAPNCVQKEADFGLRWNGELEALDRLVLGVGAVNTDGLTALQITRDQFEEARMKLIPHTYQNLIMTAAPIQDAIDLARFMVEVTKGFVRYSINYKKTVGGPIEIAAITKHEGFKWVNRKHFFSSDLNPQ
jgi:hypothetical protein